ncbi:MAG: acetate--CoA ligase family protein [Acidobacteriota bacterium]
MAGSLDRILAPRSLAVVGVSSRAESLSGRLLANLFNAGFTGPVYPVNPRAGAVRGLRCYPSVAAIPESVDLALLMVPRDAVLETVEDCLGAGARGLVVITAGFREGGDAGAEAERSVLQRVRAAGVRTIGPNCMGLINTDSTVRLDATFSPVAALAGNVAFGSHSGALGVALLELAREAGLGFSQFVSLGNSADVNVCDLLEAWEHDEATRVVMLYLEAIEEPRRFLEVAGRVARVKPVVVLKAGRSAAGQRAASSHTGALAAADTGIDAILRQAGVIRAATLEELFDTARSLAAVPPPKGRRVAIVTNAGGPAIAASDALESSGLELAALSPQTRASLRGFLPPEAAVGNPVDMLPSATSENYRDAVSFVAADAGVDALLTIMVTPIMVGPLDIAGGIAPAARSCGKPVLSVFMTDPRFHEAARGIAGLPPTFRFPEAAARALAAVALRGGSPRRDLEAPAPAPSRSLAAARVGADGFLSPPDAFALLAEVGIPVAPFEIVASTEALPDAARRLGFPVVLKGFGSALVHKTEAGAVAVGLRDADELRAAARTMAARLDAAGVAPDGYLLQRFVGGGREMILGATRDPHAGPLVMCGLGGVAVEAMRDVSFRPAPLSGADAEAMLSELRGEALLGAFRGRPPADRAALIRSLVALGGVIAANPEIAECDVNPLLVLDEGRGCVAVDARVRRSG